MDLIAKEDYPYRFDPNVCESCKGRCCVGESGYIWVNPKEIESICEFLHVGFEDFAHKYLTKVRFRYSLKEKIFDDGYACVFFDEQKKQCGIYEVRPSQCRSFPFWNYFKTRVKEVQEECPGILV